MNRLELARVLHATGALDAWLAVRAATRIPWLVVLTYHRVAHPSDETVLDRDVVDATPAQLEEHVAFLASRFHFVSIADLLAYQRGKPLAPNPVLLTFDDGYLECATRVLPILRRYDARATFFVSTSYIEERRLFWWDRVALVLARSTRDHLELTYPHRLRLALGSDGAKRALLDVVKRTPGLDVERFLDELTDAGGVSWSREQEERLADATLMRWRHVKELERAGMDIESHTRRHLVLDTLTERQLRDELAGSRADLEARLDRPVTAVSYPVGYPVSHLRRVRDALTGAGYRLGFTNQTGANRLNGAFDPYDVRRVAMNTAYDEAFFRTMLAFPPLAPRRRTRAEPRVT